MVGRPVVDLAPVLFDPAKPEDLNRRIRDAVGVIPGGIEGKLVRMRIRNLSGSNSGVVDAELMGSLRERAMFLRVDFEPPGLEQIRAGGTFRGGGRATAYAWLGNEAGPMIRWSPECSMRFPKSPRLIASGRSPLLLRFLRSSMGPQGPVAVVSDPDQDSTGLSGSSESDYPWRPASPAPGPGGYRGPERRRGGIRRALAALLELRAGRDLEKLAAAFSPLWSPDEGRGPRVGSVVSWQGLESRIDEVELAVRRLPTWEQELRDLRADAAVVGGRPGGLHNRVAPGEAGR